MHGLIGKLRAQPGQRDALAAILLDASQSGMPGCLSYIVARACDEPDALWITEIWTSAAAHQASLDLPVVQAAILQARPLIAGFDSHIITEPLAGFGLQEQP